jgi:hypothetical protein
MRLAALFQSKQFQKSDEQWPQKSKRHYIQFNPRQAML